MSDTVPSQVPLQSAVVCEVCSSSADLRWHCKNYQGPLCDACEEINQETAISSEHSLGIRPGEVLRPHGPTKTTEPCQKHESKDLSTYCNDCQVACCVSCLVESHRGHNFSTIEDAYLSAEKRLNNYIRELDKDLKGKLDEMATQTYGMNADVVHHRQKEEDDKNALRKEWRQIVDSSCDKLETPYTELSNIVRDINIQGGDELLNQCIREGELGMIRYIPPTYTALIPKVTLPHVVIPLFVANKKILQNLEYDIGAIEYRESIEPKTDKCFDVKMVNVKEISSWDAKIYGTTITVVDDNKTWMINPFHDTMCLYDSKGKVVRSFTVNKGTGIHGMCVKPSGEMIVTNRDQKVRCVDENGEVSILIDTTPFDPWGMCLNDRGEIVVCMRGQGDENHVAVFSSNGKRKLREIRGTNARGRHLITDPLSVVQNGADLCVVNGGRTVVCVDIKEGDVRWVYDARMKHFNPRGICRDKYHNLLVTDGYHKCVHYIDSEGQLIQVILTKEEQIGLVFPWGVSVDDETGQVWVGNANNQVVVATYLKKDRELH